MAAYTRRTSVRNGLALFLSKEVHLQDHSLRFHPQTQVEIASRKKIIIDEHSGRILVDSVLADEEKEKMEKLFSKF
jgi:hypothetical protein